jgi:FdhD/NarQ family
MARMMEITFRRKTGIGHEILGFKSACTISVPAAGRKSTIRRLTISSHALLSARIPPSDSVMLVSGRASFQLVQKALMASIPMLAAVGGGRWLYSIVVAQVGGTLWLR